MRHIIAGLLLAAAPVWAWAVDARKLAGFDAGYARCEKLYPQMAGQRDAAYLSLWRVKLSDKSRGELEAARQGKAYKAEHARALARLDKDKSPDLEKRLSQQCQATWAQTQPSAAAPAKPASTAPAK
jgi:hypothetical protein